MFRILAGSWKCLLTILLLTSSLGVRANAQSDELNPEIDVYHNLTPNLRFDFQAKQSREGDTPNSPEIGPIRKPSW